MKASRRVLTRYIAKEFQAGKNRDEIIQLLAAYIVEHKLKSQISLIVSDIAANLTKFGHIEATVTTARPLESSLKDSVIKYVKTIESAQDIQITENIDPALLGGIIIETPNRRFDASIATKLKRLRNA